MSIWKKLFGKDDKLALASSTIDRSQPPSRLAIYEDTYEGAARVIEDHWAKNQSKPNLFVRIKARHAEKYIYMSFYTQKPFVPQMT